MEVRGICFVAGVLIASLVASWLADTNHDNNDEPSL
jgi:hypothetical protein